ncbi:unnamed protein product [Dibothriocephalus latus]|uniref:Uncharacterized protein n=1 Tax=Dibothriocephalus latus TaxID=60516 RepID=A0A3P7NQZ5_DIBLA|nr:unnamed protein product [Dibothriocephalus latus]
MKERLRCEQDCPTIKDTVPLLSADGTTLLAEKTQILKRWAEHFRRILNRPYTIFDAATTDLDLPLTPQETIKAVRQLFSRKAPGFNAIPAEIYKHDGHQLISLSHALPGDVATRPSPLRLHRRPSYPLLQAKGEPPNLAQSSRNLTVQHHLQNLRSCSPKPFQ